MRMFVPKEEANGVTLAADHLLVPTHLLREIEIDAGSAAQLSRRQESAARWLLVSMETELGYLKRGGPQSNPLLDPQPGDTCKAVGSGDAKGMRHGQPGTRKVADSRHPSDTGDARAAAPSKCGRTRDHDVGSAAGQSADPLAGRRRPPADRGPRERGEIWVSWTAGGPKVEQEMYREYPSADIWLPEMYQEMSMRHFLIHF